MEENIRKRIIELNNRIDDAKWELSHAEDELIKLEDDLQNNNDNTIKDINNLKREMKRDRLYSDEMEEFLDNYMRFYNN